MSHDPALVAQTAALFAVIGNPSRLAVLCALDSAGSLSAGALSERLNLEASALSHHLRQLREARLVRVERRGRSRIYRLDDDHVAHIVRDALRHVAES